MPLERGFTRKPVTINQLFSRANARAGTKWSHRIDPHIDRERDWVSTDLLFIGTASAYAEVERPAAPRKVANATGDQILTDGKMSVLELGPPQTGPRIGSK